MSLLGRILKAVPPMKYRGAFVSTMAMGVLLGASIPARAASDTFNLTAERKHVPIGAGMTYNAWTYNGTVPGPVLKVRQGDEVSIKLMNRRPCGANFAGAVQRRSYEFGGLLVQGRGTRCVCVSLQRDPHSRPYRQRYVRDDGRRAQGGMAQRSGG